MVRITADFQQERVLHPAAMALLNHSFSQGWADPNKLNNNSRQTAILLQQVRQKFAEQGAEPRGWSPEQTSKFVREESEKWNTVIKNSNVSLD